MMRMESMRREKGWSRAELARRAHMDAADLGKIERGLLVPYAAQVAKLADALGVHEGAGRTLLEEVLDAEAATAN